ncbi:MAG TPA: hypothetical protein VGM33_26325 [Baekduia sp.]|jgi:hypothetical protein
MTLPFSDRSPSTLARSALVAAVLAAGAGAGVTAAASPSATDASVGVRTAVLAGPDAPNAAVARAAGSVRGAAEIRRVGGSLEAQATAAGLAGEGYAAVIGVGAQARAAVAQAAAGEVGDGTRWGVER